MPTTRKARHRAGLLLSVALTACGAAPARTETAPRAPHPVSRTQIASELATALDAGAPPAQPDPEASTPTPTCFPSPGHPCPPDRPRPTILVDPDLTPTDGGFPAISADGASIAVARIDPDGVRAAPNLVIVILRVADGAEVQRLVVLTPDEGARAEESDEPDGALAERVRARVTAASGVLSRGGFTSLFGVDFASHGPGAVQTDGRGLHFAFDPAAHTVAVGDATRERARVAMPEGARDARCRVQAPHPSHPDGAYVDLGRGVLVLHVEFEGTSACPGGAPADLVVSLAP